MESIWQTTMNPGQSKFYGKNGVPPGRILRDQIYGIFLSRRDIWHVWVLPADLALSRVIGPLVFTTIVKAHHTFLLFCSFLALDDFTALESFPFLFTCFFNFSELEFRFTSVSDSLSTTMVVFCFGFSSSESESNTTVFFPLDFPFSFTSLPFLFDLSPDSCFALDLLFVPCVFFAFELSPFSVTLLSLDFGPVSVGGFEELDFLPPVGPKKFLMSCAKKVYFLLSFLFWSLRPAG